MKSENKTVKQLIQEMKETGIISVIDNGVSIQDTDFKILYQNQMARDLMGDHVGKYCYKSYMRRALACDDCSLRQGFSDGNSHKAEKSVATDKGVLHLEITVAPLRDSKGNIIAGIEVLNDITRRKQTEEALQKTHIELEERIKVRTTELEETNTALKILLKQREKDKKDLEDNILSNIKLLILPYLEKLKRMMRLTSKELSYLNILGSNLTEIISPFSIKLSSTYLGLTPKEIQIANLIKDGKNNKDIMELLNISFDTVKTHRQNIRKKLGISKKSINLRVYLLSLK